MTKSKRPPQRKTGGLKLLLFAGSLAATLAGTQLLQIKEALQPAAILADNNPITLVEAAPTFTTILLPPTGGRQQIVLQEIPQALQPQIRPVARSRSSR